MQQGLVGEPTRARGGPPVRRRARRAPARGPRSAAARHRSALRQQLGGLLAVAGASACRPRALACAARSQERLEQPGRARARSGSGRGAPPPGREAASRGRRAASTARASGLKAAPSSGETGLRSAAGVAVRPRSRGRRRPRPGVVHRAAAARPASAKGAAIGREACGLGGPGRSGASAVLIRLEAGPRIGAGAAASSAIRSARPPPQGASERRVERADPTAEGSSSLDAGGGRLDRHASAARAWQTRPHSGDIPSRSAPANDSAGSSEARHGARPPSAKASGALRSPKAAGQDDLTVRYRASALTTRQRTGGQARRHGTGQTATTRPRSERAAGAARIFMGAPRREVLDRELVHDRPRSRAQARSLLKRVRGSRRAATGRSRCSRCRCRSP